MMQIDCNLEDKPVNENHFGRVEYWYFAGNWNYYLEIYPLSHFV